MRAIVLIPLLAASALAAEPPKEVRRVTVQGRGKAVAPPDQARIVLAVTEENARLEAAAEAARRKTEAVLKAVRAQGVAEKDVQTEQYRVEPKLRWQGGRSVREGFVASNRLRVLVRDLKKAGAVLSAALDAGANGAEGPWFEFGSPQALERKALEAALSDAKAKAALLAQGAGASLGPALEIQEGVQHPGPRPMLMKMAAMEADAASGAPQPIAAGEDAVEALVTASFELKQVP